MAAVSCYLYRFASRGMNLPDIGVATITALPAEVDPLSIARPARPDLIAFIAGNLHGTPAFGGDEIYITRAVRVSIEGDLLAIGRPAGAADRGAIERSKLRLI